MTPISGLGSSSTGRLPNAATRPEHAIYLVSECVITYDGAPTYSLSVMEITDGLVTHETQYFADPFPASPGRAALAEAIPARDQ